MGPVLRDRPHSLERGSPPPNSGYVYGGFMLIGVFLGAGVVTREAVEPARHLAAAFDGTVAMIGITVDPVAGIEPGESFQPDVGLFDAAPDVLVIPGGFGCRPMSEDVAIVDRLRQLAGTCEAVLTISTGTLLLAATGLLTGQMVAGHWLTPAELLRFGAILSEQPIERHGRLFTTTGTPAALAAVPLIAEVMLYGPTR